MSVCLDKVRQQGEIGWIISRNYHGRGYVAEAAKAVLDFAFSHLNVKRVIATCDYRNTVSIKIMEKIELSLERSDGVRKLKNGEEAQELMYSLAHIT